MDTVILDTTITLTTFIDYLKTFQVEAYIRRDFHVFILRKHDEAPDLWPLAFTIEQGGYFTWGHVFNLWKSNQLSG